MLPTLSDASTFLADFSDNDRIYGYVSCDGRYVTDWHGNIALGTVRSSRQLRVSAVLAGRLSAYVVRLADGSLAYGRGAAGMHITLRRYR